MAGAKSYRSLKMEVKKSNKIEGKGVFARELIKKGEIVAIKGGQVFDSKEYENLNGKARHYCHQIEDCIFLGPRSKEELEDNAMFKTR